MNCKSHMYLVKKGFKLWENLNVNFIIKFKSLTTNTWISVNETVKNCTCHAVLFIYNSYKFLD